MLVTALRLERRQLCTKKKSSIFVNLLPSPARLLQNGYQALVLYGLMVRKRDLMCVCKNFLRSWGAREL